MSEQAHGPAYRIETARLVIRCWHPADAPLLAAAITASVDHLRPWMPWAHSEPEALQAKIDRLRRFRGSFDLGQDYIYAIFDAAEQMVLGGTGLHPRIGDHAREIGYWIHQDYAGQGLASEASAALIKVSFEIEQLERIEIRCEPGNAQSAAIPRKLGFTHEATLRSRLPFLDQPLRDVMIWSLFRSDYPTSPAASVEIKAFDVVGRVLLS